MPELDIVIPVYNEGGNIVSTLRSLKQQVRTRARVLICYDMPDDDTLPAVRNNPDAYAGLAVEFVQTKGRGAHAAVMTGFSASTAPYVLVFPADDNYNAPILEDMVSLARRGCDIVCASRFMRGGSMVGCPLLKSVFVRSGNFMLYHFARLPARDASNGFRLFSRRTVDTIEVESSKGFCYSIELLAKVHRLRWKIGEVPAQWFERKHGKSRFKVMEWLPAYLRWFMYPFATTYMRLGPSSVVRKDATHHE